MNRNTKDFLIWVTAVLLTTVPNSSTADSIAATLYDPCITYTALDQPWRATDSTVELEISDKFFNWTGWYRLLYDGVDIRMPDSCVNESTCGTYFTLWLDGPHPLIDDGIVTLDVFGADWGDCYYLSSTPIRVKACPGDYYVYELVRPDFCYSAYCADVDTIPSVTPNNTAISDTPQSITPDPCSVYTVLDDDWRKLDSWYFRWDFSSHDDTLVEWNGWYRLYLQGKSAQIPDIDYCWSFMSCGGYTSLFLDGAHPQPQDGIITRHVHGYYSSVIDFNEFQCNSISSNLIQVKACPGNYYVYQLVKPAVAFPMPTYCAVTTTLYDPCNNYTALDQPWRATNATVELEISDKFFNWTGWYRLLYYGMDIRMPESRLSESTCGTDITLWLNSSHPQIQDGIVTRGIRGSADWQDIYYFSSTPIRVKACPGNYYVYEFIRPSLYDSAYCADVGTITPIITPVIPTSTVSADTPENITPDPCSVYSVLDHDWRKLDSLEFSVGFSSYDDTLVEWSGWYRLYLHGKSAQIPESDQCWSFMSCGGYTSLLLGGSHPVPQDGIVTREIYGYDGSVNDLSQCNSYKSNPIQVKACPGNYYVYRLVKPPVSLPMPTYCVVVLETSSYDPCDEYVLLDEPWRGANETGGYNSDRYFNWTGWYRLLYYGMSVRMPDSCVDVSRCGTDITLWLNGSHPRIEDGIVTRRICGSTESDCCDYRSPPIRVKACPGEYYVYEFVRPSFYYSAYCADQNFTVSAECKEDFTLTCAETLYYKINNSRNPVLQLDIVKQALQVQALQIQTITSDPNVTFGNKVLNRAETFVSTLVNPRQNHSVNIAVDGLDGEVFAFSLNKIHQPGKNSPQMDRNLNRISKTKSGFGLAPNVPLKETHQLSINNAQMNINLIQIAKNNNGSAAVAFMSYTNFSSVLTPNLFNSTNNTVNTMMSGVISATLPRTNNTNLTTPVNFTLKHLTGIDPLGTLSCVYWKDTEWVVDGCDLLKTNSSHSVCSCIHLSTFALIMQTKPSSDDSDPMMDIIGTIAVVVGLVFLSLALLTFALCHQNPRVTNTAQINLCINLLLAHLLFLLTQKLLNKIHSQKLVCAVMAGLLHYFFLSAFVWMFMEAAVLLVHMKNLKKIRSKRNAGLLWKWLIGIGYAVPLLVVGVSAGLVPEGYGSDSCWLKTQLLWTFLGPVSFILAANTILFICIFVIIISTLTNMKSKALKIKRPQSEHRLITSVALKTMIQFIILGCSWILGFFTQGSKALEIIFLLLNSQQGTFIFLVYCVLNQEVRQLYMKWWRALRASQSLRTTENLDTTTSRF